MHPPLYNKDNLFLSRFVFAISGISEAATWGALLKKVFLLWHRCFPVHLVKFLRTCLQNKSGRQLLAFTSIEISYLEAVVQTCSLKEVLLEISENSQESTCTRVSFLIKLLASGSSTGYSGEFCEISKNNVFYRTLSVVASAYSNKK